MPMKATIYAPFQRRFRPQRLRMLYDLFAIGPKTNVLDLGGGPFFWDLARAQGFPVPRVTVVNILPYARKVPDYISWVLGDAKQVSFADGSFDLVFSNSLVEHLSDWNSQRQFASEVQRLAPNYFVQTPDKYFPIEPHYVTPFIHWLPKSARYSLVRNCTVWGIANRPSAKVCRETVDEIKLLGPGEMRQLFSDGEIVVERFMGISKSIVAVKGHRRGAMSESVAAAVA